jgi:hypothetical protein
VTWEVRTNGRRFVVCDTGSAPTPPVGYRPRYSWATFAEADAAMIEIAGRLAAGCTPGRAARVEP